MSLWKKTMDYLGLGPDDAYDDYDDYDEPASVTKQSRGQRDAESRGSSGSNAQRGWEAEADEPTVRTVSARPSYPSRDFDASSARRTSGNGPSGRPDDSGVQVRPNPSQAQSTRTASGGSMEPHTVRPRRFDQAQEVADKFKDGQPVIMNLEGTEREVARRLIDFASGICYALDGSMEKVATGVYLLKPPVAQRSPRYDDYDD
ncbi:MAG TPA: cell division protein SepF [Ilumatobacteraceae bacterium]|nr:cell division protein SepF [Ilumatobacteraceae bacterium]